MKVLRITDPDQVRPLHVVFIGIVLATLAGSCLLTSGAHREILQEGAVEWGADSILRAVVSLLNAGFSQTTAKGVEIKFFVFSLGTALALLTLAFAVGVRPPAGEEATLDDLEISSDALGDSRQTSDPRARSPDSTETNSTHDSSDVGRVSPAVSLAGPAVEAEPLPTERRQTGRTRGKAQLSSLAAAQLMILAFGLWALLSPIWAVAADYALGGAILLAIHLAWSFALALGLNRVAAWVCGWGIVIVCTVTAGMAIWYQQERNPTLRASYPIGNPLFLAACLIPGILAAAGAVVGAVQSFLTARKARSRAMVLPLRSCIALMLYAFHATSSRGPAVGLAAGAMGLVMFAVRDRRRWFVAATLAALLGGLLWWQFAQRYEYSATGRSATLRTRFFAWAYAVDLAVESPLTGLGMGGYLLRADALAARAEAPDVLSDPQALDARLAHAHNEWLEIASDLGSIGLVLVAVGLVLTFRAGLVAADQTASPALRWGLISLMAALLGLIVEEAFSVGLRLPGLPALYYALIGLIWAMSSARRPRWMVRLETARAPRTAAFLVAAALSVGVLIAGVRDFIGARAYADVVTQSAKLEWDQALSLADQARRFSLDPEQRFEATDRLCGTCWQAAVAFQSEALRLTGEAEQSDPPDERRLALADENRRRSLAYVQRGLDELGELLKKSPASWNSGLWEQGFYIVRSNFDRMDGNQTAAGANLDAAIRAAERELRRRPFDAMVVLAYINVAGPTLEIPRVFEVLARPLRYSPLPDAYLGALRAVSANPSFATAFDPVYQAASSVTPDQPVENWVSPWAPEILRLAAVLEADRGIYEGAAQDNRRAAALYDVIRESAPAGAAACSTELAECAFRARPTAPDWAIEQARRAISLAPDSEVGRRIVATASDQIVTYLLAADREEEARSNLRELLGSVDQEPLDLNIGYRYATLVQRCLVRHPAALPPRMPTWLGRALRLNPNPTPGWEGELVRLLRHSLSVGADRQTILALVDEALSLWPTNELFLGLRRELTAPATMPGTSQPASAPAPTTPPAAPSTMPATAPASPQPT